MPFVYISMSNIDDLLVIAEKTCAFPLFFFQEIGETNRKTESIYIALHNNGTEAIDLFSHLYSLLFCFDSLSISVNLLLDRYAQLSFLFFSLLE